MGKFSFGGWQHFLKSKILSFKHSIIQSLNHSRISQLIFKIITRKFLVIKFLFSTFAAQFSGGHKVDHLKQFTIPFRGLKPGVHQYDYQIDKRFFERLEYAEVSNGNLKVELELTKQDRMLIFNFTIEGEVEVDCDRCLGKFNQAVAGNEKLFVKFGEKWEEESDDVIIIPEGEYQFDISKYLYEYIILLLPMQRIHPDDENGETTCDQDMVSRLGSHPEVSEPDPRWDALLKLKNKNKS
jgi:uncharacterized metal-binding protein YceD (DUF177 family)